ncbi:MAG: HAMP domain-containing histidine kinase [Acidobacteria bacterium]|nr:HAMP domain-containing histidine kinase [Acidobacteriota bacterium]
MIAKLGSQEDIVTMEELLVALNVVALERLDTELFKLLGSLPDWFPDIYPNVISESKEVNLEGVSPFLDNFLIDAEDFWKHTKSGHLKSGLWIETNNVGKEYYLEAVALFLEKEQKKVLLIEFSRISYEEKHYLIQTGREISLKYYQLSKEIQKKEILLHCIIHDLNTPLNSMKGALSLISLEELSNEAKELVTIGLNQADKQAKLIREVLDVFAAEVASLNNFSSNINKAPNLLLCLQEVIESLQPAFALKQVNLEISPNIQNKKNYLVVGEYSRLTRIFSNLLENALRYSPKNSTVTVTLELEDDFVNVNVDDQGVGIASDMVGHLFQKFYQIGKYRGKIGLGLYFCRMMIEQWGGTIGYLPLNQGGSRFWFKLPKPTSEN